MHMPFRFRSMADTFSMLSPSIGLQRVSVAFMNDWLRSIESLLVLWNESTRNYNLICRGDGEYGIDVQACSRDECRLSNKVLDSAHFFLDIECIQNSDEANDNLLPSCYSSANYVAGSPLCYDGVRVGCLCVVSKASRPVCLNLNASLRHHALKLEDRLMPPHPDMIMPHRQKARRCSGDVYTAGHDAPMVHQAARKAQRQSSKEADTSDAQIHQMQALSLEAPTLTEAGTDSKYDSLDSSGATMPM